MCTGRVSKKPSSPTYSYKLSSDTQHPHSPNNPRGNIDCPFGLITKRKLLQRTLGFRIPRGLLSLQHLSTVGRRFSLSIASNIANEGLDDSWSVSDTDSYGGSGSNSVDGGTGDYPQSLEPVLTSSLSHGHGLGISENSSVMWSDLPIISSCARETGIRGEWPHNAWDLCSLSMARGF